MTIVAHGDERVLDQIMKQLNKLVDVIKVTDLTKQEKIERELLLIKVTSTAVNRAEIMQIVNTFRGKIVDVSPRSMIVEVTGSKSKVDAMLELFRPFGLKEVVRTGTIALARQTELKTGSKNSSGDTAKESAKTPKKVAAKKK